MAEEKYSPKIFIGREQEIALFKELLDQPEGDKWILNIYGEGGLGKTQLIYRFIEILEQRQREGQQVLITSDPIDLFWTAHQRELGILKSIADQIAPDAFQAFYIELDKYNKLLEKKEELPPSYLHDQEQQAIDRFIDIYKKLSADRIVLFFDTAEVVSEAVLRFWQQSLPKFNTANSRTLVVIAGRKLVKVPPSKNVKLLRIRRFTPEEVSTYFKKQNFNLSQNVVRQVAELSNGRPILIALTIDWLRLGNSPEELIENQSPEQFKRSMVSRVQLLKHPEDKAILAMARFHRRFDEEILALILGQTIDQVKKLMINLSRFSFVKYRPRVNESLGSCTLHDEMRDMINEYVWSTLDPLSEYRRDWNQKIVNYYAEKIKAATTRHDQLEQQNLSQERLFYWLDIDLAAAFNFSNSLFEEATGRHDTNLMEVINDEIKRVETSLSYPMRREFSFRQAIVLHHRERYIDAIEKMKTVVDDSSCEPELRIKAFIQLLVYYSDSGSPQIAIDIGLELEKEILGQFEKIKPKDLEYKPLKFHLGILCNNIGFAYRHQNKLHDTIKYYHKALNHFSDVGGKHARIARTRNNLGYAYQRLGHNEKALTQCEIALKLRLRLDDAYELGLNYNVLGIIYADQIRVDEAIKNFNKALRAFEKADSKRGKAITNLAYGRLMRQLGWYKEDFAEEPSNPERPEYLEASKMLNEAIENFRSLSMLPYLLEALNEKGTLLRQQKYWKEAIECFEESKKLAIQVGDVFREIDNLQDLGILYKFKVELDKALSYSIDASQKALSNDAFHLYARAQMTVCHVYFERKEYDRAFEAAANACVFILRPDPSALGHTSAKKDLIFDQFENWTTELILNLPTLKLAQKQSDYIINRWKKEKIEGELLAERYPDFIEKIRALTLDYALLKEEN